MRLLAWNIQSGGARRAEKITEFVKEIAPDVAVLTEVRETSGPLLERLAAAGWRHQVVGAGAAGRGGVAIVSRLRLDPLTPPPTESAFPGRWVEAEVKDAGCTVVGLYGPLQKEDFNAFWSSALGALGQRRQEPLVVAGDMNIGESLTDAPKDNFFCSTHFQAAKELGFVDAWRVMRGEAREYSWYSRKRDGTTGNGFRLDHALVSPALASRIQSAEYRHDVREGRVSDHAPLIVEFSSSSPQERRSMRVPQRADGKGSLRWIQHFVAHPSLLEGEVRRRLGIPSGVTIEWRSPRADDEHAEYRDGAFLDRVGLGELCDKLSDFWPRGGPQWDALARTSDGKVLLFEVKAHANELKSTCAAASAKSREQIERGLAAAKAGLGADPNADWLTGYYQYANRLAHLFFLRDRCGVDAHLIFLYLVNEKDMRGPKSRSEWETAIHNVHKALGLSSNRPLTAVHDVFVDVAKLERPGTGGSGERTSA